MGGDRDDCKVYVGNLPDYVRSRDLEDVFYKYGKIVDVDIHSTRGGGAPFAFVLFDDDRDADDAIRARNGYDFEGYRLRVERCRGGRDRDRSPPRSGGGSSYYRGRGRGGGGGGGDRGGRHPNIPRRSEYRVKVGGLPPTGSWQDIKDHLREAGDVYYAEVYGDGSGIVEFARQKDVDTAVEKLDNTKFKSHEGETTYITVTEDTSGGGGGGGSSRRSRSRSPRKSYSRSPKRGRSYSRSRSRSRGRSRSRTPY